MTDTWYFCFTMLHTTPCPSTRRWSYWLRAPVLASDWSTHNCCVHWATFLLIITFLSPMSCKSVRLHKNSSSNAPKNILKSIPWMQNFCEIFATNSCICTCEIMFPDMDRGGPAIMESLDHCMVSGGQVVGSRRSCSRSRRLRSRSSGCRKVEKLINCCSNTDIQNYFCLVVF